MTHPAGTTDTVLGLSIGGGEIYAHVLDASSGELVAQNRTSAPDRDRLVQVLDEVVASAPGTPSSIWIASSEPSVQVTLADAGRRVGPDSGPLRWLTGATMVSTASALCAVASQQFPAGSPVVLAILDASGCPTTVDPAMLIDPGTSTVIATAKAFDRSAPVSDPNGAAALATAIQTLPLAGLQIPFIVATGPGAEMDGVSIELRNATGRPVRVLDGGVFAAARGAALLAIGRTTPGARLRHRFPVTPRKLAVPATVLVAALGVSALLVLYNHDRAPALTPRTESTPTSSAPPTTTPTTVSRSPTARQPESPTPTTRWTENPATTTVVETEPVAPTSSVPPATTRLRPNLPTITITQRPPSLTYTPPTRTTRTSSTSSATTTPDVPSSTTDTGETSSDGAR